VCLCLQTLSFPALWITKNPIAIPNRLSSRPQWLQRLLAGSAANEAAVRAFYAALNSNNGPALFDLFSEDVDWDCSGLPTSAMRVRC